MPAIMFLSLEKGWRMETYRFAVHSSALQKLFCNKVCKIGFSLNAKQALLHKQVIEPVPGSCFVISCQTFHDSIRENVCSKQ